MSEEKSNLLKDLHTLQTTHKELHQLSQFLSQQQQASEDKCNTLLHELFVVASTNISNSTIISNMISEISNIEATLHQSQTNKAKLHKLYTSLLQRKKQTPTLNHKTLLHDITTIKRSILKAFHEDAEAAHRLHPRFHADTDYAEMPQFSYNGLQHVIKKYSAPPFAPY